MSRPYNRKTVQDAILICDLLASNSDVTTWEICDSLGFKYACSSVRLALKAEDAVNNLLNLSDSDEDSEKQQWAEASCLLRTGWRTGQSLIRKTCFYGEITLPSDKNNFKIGMELITDETQTFTSEQIAQIFDRSDEPVVYPEQYCDPTAPVTEVVGLNDFIPESKSEDTCPWDGSDPVAEVLHPGVSEPVKVYTPAAQKIIDAFETQVTTTEKLNAVFPGQDQVTFSDEEKRQIDTCPWEVIASSDD